MSTERARSLRRAMSPAEAKLWAVLKTDAFKPFHFRRQVQFGPFYADFASHRAKLVVEVDGSQHFADDAAAYDLQRNAFLRTQGFQVLRVTTADVLGRLDSVYAAIVAHLPHPPR